jgi:nitrite reductase/ring-hydroxylating ferredoxin subunit/DMSO/TMAO reductase YedYZ heme-binding membrane subunit
MSHQHKPVGWSPFKIAYDAVLLATILLYAACFLWLAPHFQHVTQPLDDWTLRIDAFGTCALLLLTLVLCIGPLARLDPRFLPLLYNRRHLGVLTCAVALTHVYVAFDWYFTASPLDPYVALLSANTSFARLHGFPFELFGLGALLILLLLASTSHDFWLAFLGPAVWKALHMAIYAGYVLVVLHVSLGAMQDAHNPLLGVVLTMCMACVIALHLAAMKRESATSTSAAWINAGPLTDIPEGRAIVVHLDGAESVAIFRHAGKLSAVSNVCAHQNGPLGEGRIVDGCITCPWHGYQYRPEDGCAPLPFTEKLATYRIKLADGIVLLDPRPNPPGTFVEPTKLPHPPRGAEGLGEVGV